MNADEQRRDFYGAGRGPGQHRTFPSLFFSGRPKVEDDQAFPVVVSGDRRVATLPPPPLFSPQSDRTKRAVRDTNGFVQLPLRSSALM